VLLWVLLIPVGVLWTFMEPLLLAIKEPPRLCKDVQDILRILLFGAPGYIAFESLKKYLQCQGQSRATPIISRLTKP
jgi:MATE family multidrug resistance protein